MDIKWLIQANRSESTLPLYASEPTGRAAGAQKVDKYSIGGDSNDLELVLRGWYEVRRPALNPPRRRRGLPVIAM